MVVDGKEIPSQIGVIQGDTASPYLYSIFVNPLLLKLTRLNIYHAAFADDLIVHAKTEGELIRAIHTIEDWCKAYDISINYSKSGIIMPNLQNRQYLHVPSSILHFPVVQQYKVLGVYIDQSASCSFQINQIEEKVKQLDYLLKLSWAKKLPPTLRYYAWNSVVISKFTYGNFLLAFHFDLIHQALTSFLYRAIKRLLKVKGNISKDLLAQACLELETLESFTDLKA